MDNLGYKEGSTKPKPKPLLHRRVSRAVSLQVENEAVPLSLTSRTKCRFKTVPPNIRWRPEPNTVIDETLPGNNFHFMEMGPSPPAEGIPSIYDSFEEPSSDISVHVGSDTIRNSIGEQMKLVAGRAKLLEDIEQGNVILENVTETFEDATKSEKNLCLLWCAFLKRWDLLEPLIEAGADPLFVDNSGMTALHLSAFSGCLTSTSFFISKELDVNSQAKYFSPLHMAAFGNSPETARLLINNGAKLDTFSGKPNCEESLLHVAVRANALECVRLFISEGMDVNSLKPNGTNAIHLAADLGASDCLRVLLECKTADPNIKICVREKESTALHLAADEGNVECVNLLLNRGANAKLKNHRGFTALHLAARTSSLECVESLLRNGGADPNAEDFEQRTPLHAAVGKSESAFDILETLIQWGAEVNKKDKYGFSALHLAALENLSQCVELLIFHGADVTTKSKKGTSALNVITRKTPASLAMVRQKLDAAITMTHSQEAANREVELQLDFRTILQYCHPREISFLNTFVDEGQKEILQHPLCSAFLYIKWGKIRKYYIARLLFCFTFVLFLTLYVLTALAHNCYNGSKDMEETIQEQELCQKQSILGDMLRNNPFVMEMQWWVLVAITIVEICRKIYGITGYSSFRHYVTQVENIIEWFVIVSVFVISYIYTNRTYTWQNHIGAFAVLLGWINLMLMIGQLPVLGAYVAMYTKVQGEFAKLFMAYSCMLVGFTISFCVIFPSSSSFANPFMGFITVLVMMTGEQDLELLINDPDGKDPPFLLEISAQITFVLFLLFVTVILMNLLVGIAVHDIQGLKKTAGLSKLVRQTKLISYIESALFNGWLPDWLRSLLHYTALVSPTAYRVVLSVKPLNPGEKRLPRDILMAAYEVAKHHKLTGRTVSPKNNPPSSTFTNYFSYKTKYESNHFNNNVLPNGGLINTGSSTGNFDLHSHRSSNHYDIGYNGLHHDDDGTDSIVCSLTTKIDENAEKIDKLANEIRELKSALSQNHLVIEQLLTIISNQHKNSFKQ